MMNKLILGANGVAVCALLVLSPVLAQTQEQSSFLLKVQKDSAHYFWEEANPDNGLIKDASGGYSPCSIASVGFGLVSLCVLEKHGWKSRDAVMKRIVRTLKTMRDKVDQENGFFYHFVSMKDGRRVWKSEVSSIDTALLVAGALFAGEYFKNTEVEQLAQEIYERVDWPWMMNNKDIMDMGYRPESGFLPYYWDSYNEGMILYALAIGSPTHPIPKETWWAWKRPVTQSMAGPMVYCHTGSLFVYQFAHAFLDFRNLYDGRINYWKNSVKATLANRYFCIENKSRYKTYDDDVWGLTACLGPDGYKGYGAEPCDKPLHDGTVAPSAVAGSLPFTPKLSIAAMEAIYARYGSMVYGRYGFYDAFNADKNWSAKSYIGINQGITVMMIENMMDHTIWAYFMKHPAIKKWASLCMNPAGKKKLMFVAQRAMLPTQLAMAE